MTGSLTIAGLGPGSDALVTPEVSAALAAATDILGYAPYVARQEREWEVVRRDSRVWIPTELDYRAIPGLSNEMAERLTAARPETLDQASRVAGVTPAALSALYVATNRRAAAA